MDVQHHAIADLPPGMTLYPLQKRLGETRGRSGRQGISRLPPGFGPRPIQPLANRYTESSIPVPVLKYTSHII